MLKEIREIKDGVMRITSLSERWYAKMSVNEKTGLPEYIYYPSSTWISSYYPKGIYFYKWLAEKGWDEAESLKQAAGERGSRVHHACEDIDNGKEINITDKYLNPSTKQQEELSKEEVDCIVSYRDFLDEVKPELLAQEITSFGDVYAGTADKIFAIKEGNHRQIWVVDLKTSQSIWAEYELQISSYSHMHFDYKNMGITDDEWQKRKLAILQIGYKKNSKGYKFTEMEDKYNLFRNVAYEIWKNENPDVKPKERDYPLVIFSKLRRKNKK
ncbi:MAG: hypothetical protein A3C58_02390 [Candidatus Staskawiczbacteria bacterium RIFCSPHIGHO2_02_FULL_34_10]|uniref:PD-(D/E)XK endonuclease-like domain-containing protein n=1 Tax=Candidatus Staskawiczbacteria bacterium RIFCSPHIGHO2_02_FULL_34_10 TaxID=1802205 RepID=A0A1G2HY88_9BACT|nr:MAG: hypothetical protein A3C58_02390 [Candidatus Staskawiczbacteria bacterium RIFCSPHIGHO2_02_FULL_34_10]